jgi:hypothetical protein
MGVMARFIEFTFEQRRITLNVEFVTEIKPMGLKTYIGTTVSQYLVDQSYDDVVTTLKLDHSFTVEGDDDD